MALPRGFLRGSVGAGMENDSRDVIGVKQRLSGFGFYHPPPDGTTDGVDRALDEAIRTFQDGAGLKVDGYLEPGGETERNLIAWSTGEGFDEPPTADELTLTAGVGEGGQNHPRDVSLVKRALGSIGRYPYDRTRPPPPYIDRKLVDAIRSLQRDQQIYDDGLVTADDETIAALRRDIAASKESVAGQTKPAGDHHGEVQVAALPAAVAVALPWLLQAAQAASRYAPRVIGGTIGGAAAQQAIDEKRERDSSKYESIPPAPPLPPSPGEPFEPPEHEKIPADPPELPPDTSFPKPNDPKDLIEIFPDQSGEFSLPIIVESRGKGMTLILNDLIRDFLEKRAAKGGHSAVHTGGSTGSDGKNKTETWMPHYATKGRKGSSRVDITFTSKKTGRRLFINSTDTLADRVTPSKREGEASVRIVLNGESGDIVLLIGKIREGESLDMESLERLVDPLLAEIDRPAPEIDHRYPEEIQKRIHVFRPNLPPRSGR